MKPKVGDIIWVRTVNGNYHPLLPAYATIVGRGYTRDRIGAEFFEGTGLSPKPDGHPWWFRDIEYDLIGQDDEAWAKFIAWRLVNA